MYCPCKDCPDRHVGCQGECDKYKAFREDLDKVNAQRYAQEAAVGFLCTSGRGEHAARIRTRARARKRGG